MRLGTFGLSLLGSGDLARLTNPTLGRSDRESLGQQVVTGVPIRHLNDLVLFPDVGDILLKKNLHKPSSTLTDLIVSTFRCFT
jgi:hypothetical protein